MALVTFMYMKSLIGNAGVAVFADKMSQKLQFGNSLDASLTDNKIFCFGNGVF